MIKSLQQKQNREKTRKDWRLHTTLLNLSPGNCTLNSSKITPSKSISHSFIMSAAPNAGAVPTTKATSSEKSADSSKDVKPAAALEEDDEFEDFPVESMLCLIPSTSDPFGGTRCTRKGNVNDHMITDWTQEETEVPGDNTHLWEESWDDDDTSEDFSAQLRFVADG
jgi:26 proteasome complex subunit DSS1